MKQEGPAGDRRESPGVSRGEEVNQMEEYGERGATAACRQAEAALRTWLRRDMAEKEGRERM